MVSAPPSEPAAVRAEAAAWVARLQSPDRDAATEAAFRRWVESDADHARAFNKATEVWVAVAGAAADLKPSRPSRTPVLASVAALAIVGGGAAVGLLADPAYATRVGEQRTVRLDDGTRIVLNTDTRIVVDYSKGERRVRLTRGEALFEVAKNPHRPFIVRAQGREVRALGTAFVVRDEGKAVAVTLIEGKVAVTPGRPVLAPRKDEAPVVLTPGERLRVNERKTASLDRPRIEAVTAWRGGQILLDDTPLEKAVAEMNRYSPTPIDMETDRIGALRVSGVFKTGEVDAFARTVAAQYDLALIHDGGRLLLAEAPPPQ